VAGAALLVYVLVPAFSDMRAVMDAARAVAVAAGCKDAETRLSARRTGDRAEIEVRCAAVPVPEPAGATDEGPGLPPR
jgi:hypothetical protein